MRKIITLFCLAIISLNSYSQTWQDTVSKIEKAFSRYTSTIPGAQFAISRNGKIIYSQAWGMADLEHAVTLTTNSPIEAGSVSKQFTAAAVLLAEQQGKLSLDDDIRKYFPELPDYGYKISIRQMMQHTSGLKDWGAIMSVAGWPRGTKTYNNNDALYVISNQKTLNHKPGDEFIYSNSNYNLFAVLIQRTTGMSLADFSNKYIFAPAGMKLTQWRDNFKRVVPNRAIAYAKSGNAYITNMPNENVYGNGGLLSTAEDLLTWSNYYFNEKLGTPSLLSKQLTSSPRNNGVMHFYAAGLFIDSVRGWKHVWHDGATASYRSFLEYFPETGMCFAWLSNSSEFDRDTSSPFEDVRNLFIRNKEIVNNKPAAPVPTLTIEKLQRHSSWYRNTRSGDGLRIFMRDGKLVTSRGGLLVPVSESAFNLGPNRIEFSPGKALLIMGSLDSITLLAVDSAQLNEAAMKEYTGEYYSDETESKFFVQVKAGKLVIIQKPSNEFVLTPTYKDGFETPMGIVYFERDKNVVTRMKITVSRARNIAFYKTK